MTTHTHLGPALRAIFLERDRYRRGGPDREPDQLICHPAFWQDLQNELYTYYAIEYPTAAQNKTVCGLQLTICDGLPLDTFVLAKALSDVH